MKPVLLEKRSIVSAFPFGTPSRLEVDVNGSDIHSMLQTINEYAPVHDKVIMNIQGDEERQVYGKMYGENVSIEIPDKTPVRVEIDRKTGELTVDTPMKSTKMNMTMFKKLGNEKAQGIIMGEKEVENDPILLLSIDNDATAEDVEQLRKDVRNNTPFWNC